MNENITEVHEMDDLNSVKVGDQLVASVDGIVWRFVSRTRTA